MNKKIIVPVLTAAMVGAAAFGVSKVSAQATEDDTPSIVERIAARFNLDQDEVKAVFDEERAEQMAHMQQQMENRLREAVASGELTEDQKNLIMDKQAELQAELAAEMESLQDLTQEERQAAIEAKRDEMKERHQELKAWAEEHDINMKYLMVVGKFHGGKGHFNIKFSDDGATKDVMVTETVEE